MNDTKTFSLLNSAKSRFAGNHDVDSAEIDDLAADAWLQLAAWQQQAPGQDRSFSAATLRQRMHWDFLSAKERTSKEEKWIEVFQCQLDNYRANRELLQKLTDDTDTETRAIINHLVFDRMTEPEIAVRLGISERTVRNRIAEFVRVSKETVTPMEEPYPKPVTERFEYEDKRPVSTSGDCRVLVGNRQQLEVVRPIPPRPAYCGFHVPVVQIDEYKPLPVPTKPVHPYPWIDREAARGTFVRYP